MSIWHSTCPFGGGHTTDSDPSTRGWKYRGQGKDEYVLVLGRKGVKGCMSAIFLSDYLEVAVYDELTPIELSRALETRSAYADAYVRTSPTPGWALPLIQQIEREGSV